MPINVPSEEVARRAFSLRIAAKQGKRLGEEDKKFVAKVAAAFPDWHNSTEKNAEHLAKRAKNIERHFSPVPKPSGFL